MASLRHLRLPKTALLAFAWALFATIVAPPGHADPEADVPSFSWAGYIHAHSLRAEGRYEEVLARYRLWAEELPHLGYNAKVYMEEEMIARVATIEAILSLAPEDREEMRIADSLRIVGFDLWSVGDYVAGVQTGERALTLMRRHLKGAYFDLAHDIYRQACCLSHSGDYARAEPLFFEALQMQEELFGPFHATPARTLEYLGELHAVQGNLDRAAQYYDRAERIWAKIHGCPVTSGQQVAEDTTRLLTRMAELAVRQGDYARAQSIAGRALANARARWKGENANWLIAMLVNCQAVVLWKQGDYGAAMPLFREALALRRENLGPEHPHYVQSLNALACVLSESGEVDVAESLLRETLDQFKKIRRAEHQDISETLLSLASLARSQGNYAAADSLCREALAISQHIRGPHHADVADCLHQLAVTHLASGKVQEADRILRAALDMYESSLGRDHADAVPIIHDLALSLLALGRPDEAESTLTEAIESYEVARKQVGSGFARATFQSPPYAALAAAQLQQAGGHGAWPVAERSNGRALAEILATSGGRLSPPEHARRDSLQRVVGDLEVKVAVLQRAAARDSCPQRHRNLVEMSGRLSLAKAAWADFQTEIDHKYQVTEGRDLTLAQVQATLTNEMALIVWLYVDLPAAAPLAWGYVIRNEGPVRWTALDAGRRARDGLTPVERARDFREALAIAASWSVRAMETGRLGGEANLLCDSWFEPLAEHLDGVTQLVVIPSGPMLGIPIEALVDGDQRYLGDRFVVSYAPSATIHTWLCEQRDEPAVRTSRRALLVGDPAFRDEHLNAMKRESAEEHETIAPLMTSAQPLEYTVVRSALAGHGATLGRLPRLPWTRQEVSCVAETIPTTVTLLGGEATEQRLTEMAEAGVLKTFDTIHLATHALVDDLSPQHSALVLSQTNLPDPLDAIAGGSRFYDGLLSAREIVREWDLDADLVTLSGCQTGLGRQVDGEGYLGLASAFLQAGARSLVVSLWKAEEEATTMLMTRFYENLAGRDENTPPAGVSKKPVSKAKALHDAKAWLRSYQAPDGSRPFQHPTYWSGFVLIGAP